MSPKIYIFLAVSALFVSYASADIINDFLGFDLMGAFTGVDAEEKKSPAGQREEEDEEDGSTCKCEGTAGCNCCVDFNLTSIIDLGGPGCVKMRYISQEAGIALNVSYGDSLLHSEVVKKNNKKGSCMNLLADFAQICAKFGTLRATDDGYEGCLHFEPHVLGEATAKYHIGCFKMGPEGMTQDEKLAEVLKATAEEKPSAEEEDDETPSILDVVGAGAEQGIAFFTDLLGIKRPGKKNKTTTESPEVVTETAAEAEAESEESQEEESRKFSLGRLGRKLPAKPNAL